MTGAVADSPALLQAIGLRKTRADSERRFEVRLPALVLAPRDRLALVGPSGSGKSTILALLSLATHPDTADATARFELGNADVLGAWERGEQALLAALRARRIAFLPQRDGLLEFLTVRQNILCCAELAEAMPVDALDEIVATLGLAEFLDALPAALSGGQRQRAAVACALARRPALILADEPTAALDADNVRRVLDSLVALADSVGAALVLATHQLHLVAEYRFSQLAARSGGDAAHRLSTFEAVA